MTNNKKIFFGLVGCGRIAQRHAEHITNNGILKAVCDNDVKKADELAAKYNAKAYYSIEDFLNGEQEIQVLSICSPNGLHAQHTIQALKAKKHVVCEKPMAITVADCGRMINEAEKANRRLFIIKQNRFNPPVEALKKVIDDGRLGKILSVQLSCFWNRNFDYYKTSDWKGKKNMDGGTLYTQFSHFIDLLYWLIGDVKRATGFIGNFAHEGGIEFEDTGVVAMEFYNGAIGTLNYTVNSYGKTIREESKMRKRMRYTIRKILPNLTVGVVFESFLKYK